MITLNEAEAVEIGFFAVEEKDESRIFQALDSLTGIAAGFLSKNEEADAQRVIHSIEEIAQAAAEKKWSLLLSIPFWPSENWQGQQQKRDMNPS